MYESDSESSDSFEEQKQQFYIHQPTNITKTQPKLNNTEISRQKIYDYITQIEAVCQQIEKKVLMESIEQFCQQIIDGIFENNALLSNSTTNIYSFNKSKSILPLIVSKNQQHFVPMFTKCLHNQFLTKLDQFRKQSLKIKEIMIDQFKLNNGKKIKIIYLKDNNVNLIARRIHKMYRENTSKEVTTIIITENVTDLGLDNIDVFKEGLQQYNCILLIPTFKDFQTINYFILDTFQVVPYKMYKNKYLFYEYMYQCIINPNVMAYLPKQSMVVIREFQQFPLSYSEGCRRLNYWIRKFHHYMRKNKITLSFIDIDKLFEIIDKSFEKKQSRFLGMTFELRMKNRLKNINCILNDKSNYDILKFYESKFRFDPNTDVDDNIKSIRYYLQKKMKLQPTLYEYCAILESNPFEIQKQTKSRRRIQDRYEIQIKKYYTERIIFEEQLRRIILTHTFKIREQASLFPKISEQIKYMQRIKPMVVQQIYEAMMNTHLKECINYLTKYNKRDITQVFSELQRLDLGRENNVNADEETKQKIEYGRQLFVVKQLQLYGIININSFLINSKVYPNYYPKANFWASNKQNNKHR